MHWGGVHRAGKMPSGLRKILKSHSSHRAVWLSCSSSGMLVCGAFNPRLPQRLTVLPLPCLVTYHLSLPYWVLFLYFVIERTSASTKRKYIPSTILFVITSQQGIMDLLGEFLDRASRVTVIYTTVLGG